ncbi:MAG TPA: helix-turn-helix domain-containing protein [Devosiaceae bacterium]|nr:helix-turn-helix domain-containing protein [Devosiaceae bacterium]
MPVPAQSSSETIAKLLLVDRERPRASSLVAGFCRFFAVGLDADEAACGRRAAEALRAASFDILLIDLMSLSDLAPSPAEGVARLVKLAEGALTIVLSDASTVSAAVEVMGAGAHDFVARPIGADMLADRVAELAQRHGKAHLLGNERPARENPEPGGFFGFPIESRAPTTNFRSARPAILPMWQQEQRIIEEAIASCAGNVALAAAALELSPSTIYRKRQAWAEADDKRGAA